MKIPKLKLNKLNKSDSKNSYLSNFKEDFKIANEFENTEDLNFIESNKKKRSKNEK